MRPSRWFVIPSLVILMLGTSSCDVFRRVLGVPDDCTLEEVDVSTSDSVFRGTWVGVVEGWPTELDTSDLTLIVDATFEDDGRYLVSGTFELEGESPLSLDGDVTGGCFQTYVDGSGEGLRTESIPPPVALDADARDVDTLVWRVDSLGLYFTPDSEDRATVEVVVERVDTSGDVVFWDAVTLTRTAVP